MKSLMFLKTQKTLLVLLLFLFSGAVSKLFSQENASVTKWFEAKVWLKDLQLTPHKTIDQQEFKKQYEANQPMWDKAFRFLKETNLAALKPGRYMIDGNDVFALVTEGPGRSADTAKWEGHQRYVDIHHLISGKEKIGLAPISSATVITPYDSGNDIGFYKANGTFYESGTDMFFIVFPKDAHLPVIKLEGDQNPIKKIVIKVRIAG